MAYSEEQRNWKHHLRELGRLTDIIYLHLQMKKTEKTTETIC